MLLLSFTVRNHKSIRDEITVDLARPELQSLRAPNDDWKSVVYPLAGIFGGNATGKSALLNAIRYAFTAISLSSTTWQASKSMPRAPFLLDGAMQTSSSAYELDFIHEGHRHTYGFEADAEGIKREWLRYVPTSRWRTLLERNRDANTLKFDPSLRTKLEVTPRELVLSRALLLPDSPLHAIAYDLTSSFDYVLVNDRHRERRLSGIADSLAEGRITFTDLEALLRVSDIGVEKVGIKETNLPEHLRQLHDLLLKRRLPKGPDNGAAHPDDADDDGNLNEADGNLAQIIVRHLVFTHHSAADQCPEFSVKDESDGTVAWLSIAVPALKALRKGGLLLIDEIDASLHPHLLDLLLDAFANPSINAKQAQLIFTSHESYILSPLSEVELEPEQVWFTDKTYKGVTELTCLADFPKHADANVAKRYLHGRYGGIPRLSPNTLAALVDSEAH